MENIEMSLALAIMEEEMRNCGEWQITKLAPNGFFYTRETDYSCYNGVCEIIEDEHVFAELKVANK